MINKAVLRKGLNYSVPNGKSSIPKFIACVKNTITNNTNSSP